MEEQRRTPSDDGGPTELSGPRGEDGMVVLSYTLSGILLYGGLGWLGAKYLHQTWMLPVGLILGLGFSIYLIVKRFGSLS
ncbi:hypothetical protein [Luteococcus peritonei]|uniref:AtpZ/AtpI family protein n=1 Tax=Luteococcus peritonei TaxID=88874 RepID=A0ABW4RYH7_9ACTN